MADAIDRQVEKAIKDEEPSAEEIRLLKEMHKKYGSEPERTMIISMLLQGIGFGRNRQTAQDLRCVADMLESAIENAEQVRARLGIKPQGN